MPLSAIAQTRPYFFRTAQSSGAASSTDLQRSSLATRQVVSMSHLSPAELKHQKAIDCGKRPTASAAREEGDKPDRTDAAAALQNASRRVTVRSTFMVIPL